MHALIIEDEPLLSLQIEDHLRELGFVSFDFAATEVDAVNAANLRCPDLITSDVRLAAGCGISAVQAICRKRPVPVVFITATEAEVHAREPGAVVLRKPLSSAALERAVAEVS